MFACIACTSYLQQPTTYCMHYDIDHDVWRQQEIRVGDLFLSSRSITYDNQPPLIQPRRLIARRHRHRKHTHHQANVHLYLYLSHNNIVTPHPPPPLKLINNQWRHLTNKGSISINPAMAIAGRGASPHLCNLSSSSSRHSSMKIMTGWEFWTLSMIILISSTMIA